MSTFREELARPTSAQLQSGGSAGSVVVDFEALRLAVAAGRVGCIAWARFEESERLLNLFGPGFLGRYLAQLCQRLEDLEGAVQVPVQHAEALVVWFEGLDPLSCAERMLELRQLLQEPIGLAGHRLRPACRIGWACAPQHGLELDALLRRARLACSRDGSIGDPSIPFSYAQERAERDALRIDCALHEAIARNEIELHYQALVDPHAMAVTAVEALVRWRHDGQLLQPDQFLPAWTRAGLLPALGLHCLERAVADYALMRDALGRPLRLSVNLSNQQLEDPNLVPSLRHLLSHSRIEPHRLEVELTEHACIRDHGPLHALRGLGLRLALDDFGTGAANLEQLFALPIDRVKLDRSVLTRLAWDHHGELHLGALARLVRGLKAGLVLEGVESIRQLELARSQLDVEVQGFLFHVPGPLPELLRWLQRRPEPRSIRN